ncbi:hypothetical protein D3C87_1688440 [compost metagenome]
MRPRDPEPATPTWGSPELGVAAKRLSPLTMRPTGLVKVATATWPSTRVRPLEKTPWTVPEASTATPVSEPDE